jgi:iron complex transport system ATP-binding protein
VVAGEVEAGVVMELRAAALSYGYPGRTIGTDVDVALTAGEVVCVLGPNGGGKTTLFRTLLGLLPVQAGHIALGGRPLQDWSRRNVARVVGYVPQAHTAHFAFTVREIVLMGRTAHVTAFAAPSHRDLQAAEAALATLGIGHLADRVYTEVSGGERQLTLIARALAQEAELLLLDEPTASLDFGNQLRVLDQLRGLAEQGIGVLFSTHDPDHAFLCAERVLMLRDGRILAAGRPDDVVTRDNLRQLYGVEVEVVMATLPDGRTSRLCVPGLQGLRAARRPRPASTCH